MTERGGKWRLTAAVKRFSFARHRYRSPVTDHVPFSTCSLGWPKYSVATGATRSAISAGANTYSRHRLR